MPDDGDIVDHPMMTEIKLKNSIVFNCKSSKITGFIEEKLNANIIFENILSLTKANKTVAQIAVYTNRWRFRLTTGHIHNGDFYFSTGRLDSNELVR